MRLPEQQSLILEVRLNGALSPLLWQFELLPDGTLATSPDRLRQLGFDLALLGVWPGQPLVRLSDLPGIRYRYIENTQSVEIDAVDAALVPVVLDRSNAPTPIDPDKIEQNLGDVLSVPASAVLDTGTRNIAFVDRNDGHLEPREVKIGAKTDDYWQVLDGLKPGEKVVTRALFLVDSESQLRAVVAGMGASGEHKH